MPASAEAEEGAGFDLLADLADGLCVAIRDCDGVFADGDAAKHAALANPNLRVTARLIEVERKRRDELMVAGPADFFFLV